MKNIKLFILLLTCSPFIMAYTVEDKDISVTVGEVDVPVYNIEVTWDSMQFTYKETVNYIWNDANHTYELSESTYKWNTSNNVVNINNKSAIPIDVELKYLSEQETINGTFDISKSRVPANKNITSKLTLNGSLSSNNTNYIKVGSINILVS